MAKGGLKILFVEDNPDDVELEVMELERDGLQLEWKRVDTAVGLSNEITNWRPDIILSDHSMPNFNGLEALEISLELAPEIPLIFVSGTIGEERAIESIRLGATDYILKDNLKRLSTSIQSAVKQANERKRAAEVEKEKSRMIAILENTSDLVVIANPDWSIFYINQGAREMLNLHKDKSEVLIKDLHARWSWDFIENELHTTMRKEGTWQGEAAYVATDGTEIPVSQVVIAHKDNAGSVEYYSFLARDIRTLKDYEKKIQYLANFNSLTGLPNRLLLSDRAKQAINYCEVTGLSLALLIIDIDRFKLVNDGYGLETGDELLKQFGDRLRAAINPQDTVAHLNANCFAMLAAELSSPHDVIMAVRKVLECQHEPFSIHDRTLSVTASIGVSMYPRDGKDFSVLFQNADLAMHKSKEKDEDSYQFYAAEMTQSAAERISLEQDLGFALQKDDLELFYQPQVSIEDDGIVGVEALLRWKHPERGMISPDVFIPIAESSDLIYPIGEWVIETACKQLLEWNSVLHKELRMAVNVSARQFRSKGFPDMVKGILAATKISPEQLEVELTESTLIHDHDETVRILNQLNNIGVQIALDDFGTGYSNLSYLSRLPIHCLKIDRAFVKRSLIDKNDAEIVKAIIALSRSLGLRVVAEGIESDEQLELLRNLGCNEGQGYLFSRPKRVANLTKFLLSDSVTILQRKKTSGDNPGVHK